MAGMARPPSAPGIGAKLLSVVVLLLIVLAVLGAGVLLVSAWALRLLPQIREVYAVLPSAWIAPAPEAQGWERGLGYWIVTGIAMLIGVVLVTLAMAFVARAVPWRFLSGLLVLLLSVIRAAIVCAAILLAVLAVPVLDGWPADDAATGWPTSAILVVACLPPLILGILTSRWGLFLPRREPDDE